MHSYPTRIALRVRLKCFLHYYLDKTADKKLRIRNKTKKWKQFVSESKFDHGGGSVSSYSGSGGGGRGGSIGRAVAAPCGKGREKGPCGQRYVLLQLFQFSSLDAPSHLYNLVCRSVCRSAGHAFVKNRKIDDFDR